MPANGTAIRGVCVNRRKHRADPGTLAEKLSRCKEVMARVFAVMVQILWVLAVSRYKVNRWHGIYPGIVILLTALARSRYKAIEIYPGAGAKAKTVTIQMPFIVRVS